MCFYEELEKGTIKDVDRKHLKTDWAEIEKLYVSTRFITLAIKAFHLGKISKGKLAEYVRNFLTHQSYFTTIDMRLGRVAKHLIERPK